MFNKLKQFKNKNIANKLISVELFKYKVTIIKNNGRQQILEPRTYWIYNKNEFIRNVVMINIDVFNINCGEYKSNISNIKVDVIDSIKVYHRYDMISDIQYSSQWTINDIKSQNEKYKEIIKIKESEIEQNESKRFNKQIKRIRRR
ncbi:hypothetical protein [Clostridium butyricum]|uniref:hypothetical protein n=1 Tax=Clostridium butyricum TaxID=1492 RepID=UPI00325B5981